MLMMKGMRVVYALHKVVKGVSEDHRANIDYPAWLTVEDRSPRKTQRNMFEQKTRVHTRSN